MLEITANIFTDFAQYTFEPDDIFMWQPTENTIYFHPEALKYEAGVWSLLHEVGHARLQHKKYRDDLELLMMEVAAWTEAKQLAAKYDVSIAEQHIEQSLDSYRHWLHQRSRCVACGMHAFQANSTTYRCHNCAQAWKVPQSKLCQVRKTRVIV